MVDKGLNSGMNIILAKVCRKESGEPDYHLVAVDWPKETKNWNKKEKERALKDLDQLVKRTRGITARMY